MYTGILNESRPEAMGDVPGVCELPLTRAVVQYRDVHELDQSGGRIQDIGLALVLEGRYASAAEVIDLGSAELKNLDLSSELVALDWVYEPTLEHIHRLILEVAQSTEGRGNPSGAEDDLTQYSFRLALSVLERVGFGPLTRPTVLRIGFRDICRDLDLHEGTSVRVVLGPGRIVRTHLDYDASALLVRTALADPDPELESVLEEAFAEQSIDRVSDRSGARGLSYRIRFPLPLSLRDARNTLASMRLGIGHVLACFEPDRYQAVHRLLHTFGARETLARLRLRESTEECEALRGHDRPSPIFH